MQPTKGRTVLYKLSQYDADAINQNRKDAGAFNRSIQVKPEPGERGRSGHLLHTGNQVSEGDVFPAVVVAGWGASVNLYVLLDGNDTYWATSRAEGDGPGFWSWPEIKAAGAAEAPAPKVGDVVHYLSFGTPVRGDGSQAYTSECRAAIVTELTEVEVNVNNPAGDGIFRQTVGLMVANPTGQFFSRGVVYVDAAEAIAHPETCGGTWHHAAHA